MMGKCNGLLKMVHRLLVTLLTDTEIARPAGIYLIPTNSVVMPTGTQATTNSGNANRPATTC